MSNHYPYPDLQVTDYEKQFVGHYDVPPKGDPSKPGYQPARPGVLKRVYRIDLFTFINGTSPFPTIFPSQIFADSIQVARRAKIHAIVPVGDVDKWFVNIRNASGESLTPQPPNQPVGQPNGVLVSSMQTGTGIDFLSTVNGVTTNNPNFASTPITIEPGWELSPNQTLIFEGSLAPGVSLGENGYSYCGFGVHVWEYPGMSGR